MPGDGIYRVDPRFRTSELCRIFDEHGKFQPLHTSECKSIKRFAFSQANNLSHLIQYAHFSERQLE